MAETSPETETAGAPPLPPPTKAGRERGVQLIGVGFVGTALALLAAAVASDHHIWEVQAALLAPLALSLGVTWIVVGRVSPISCLMGLLGVALSFLAMGLVALKYTSV